MGGHCPCCRGYRKDLTQHSDGSFTRIEVPCPGVPLTPEVQAVVEAARAWRDADYELIEAISGDDWEMKSERYYGTQEILRSSLAALDARRP